MTKIWPGILMALLMPAVPLQALPLSSPSYVISVDAIATGGGSSASAGFKLSQLAGQAATVGSLSSAGYRLHSGFYGIRRLEELLQKRATSLIVDNTTVYAGFNGEGIWKSLDGGQNWVAANTQPTNRQIRSLALHPITRTTLYAASYGGGVFVSTDGGDNWNAYTTGLTNLNALTLAIDRDGVLYAGTEGGIFARGNSSVDWSAANTGLPVSAVTPPVSIAIDPSTPNILYAGLDGAGVFKSSDSGANWAAVSNQPGNLQIKALALKPGDSAKLFAATYGSGLFQSTDSGETWAACANTGLTNQNLVSLVMNGSGKLYAGTEAGIFVSVDDGASWTEINSGLP